MKSRGRINPHPSFEDGVRYMRVVQAVADSRARNEWVRIAPEASNDQEIPEFETLATGYAR